MQKLKAVWANIQDTLWFLPALITIGSVAAALLVVGYHDELQELTGIDPNDFWWLFGGGSEAARTILDVIAGSIITVTGVIFSVVIIVLQLTSSQFTPRVLRTFTADRGNQFVLGIFIGTFAYTLMVQRAIRESSGDDDAFVPAFAVTLAIVLVLISIGSLIFFINHTTRSIQASVIIDSVTRDTRRVVERMLKREAAVRAAVPADRPAHDQRAGEPRRVGAESAGYVQAVDEDALFSLADRHDLYLEIGAAIGDFALPGQPLLAAWPAARVDDTLASQLRGAYYLGLERTPHQDYELGLIELVDIAVKAMSPSVNDPTTAIGAIDRLAELLVLLGRHRALDCERTNPAGRVCLVVRRPSFARAVTLTFDQIRHHSAGNPAVMGKLIDRLGEIGELSLPEHRARVSDAIDTALHHAEREITEPTDRAAVARAAAKARRAIAGAGTG